MFSKLFTTFSLISAAILNTTPVSARITGITAPPTAFTPGQSFPVTFHTEDFIQNNSQYYVLFGLTQSSLYYESALGTLLGTGYDLVLHGDSNNNLIRSFNVTVTIPSDYDVAAPGGQYTLIAAVLGTVGVLFNSYTLGTNSELWIP